MKKAIPALLAVMMMLGACTVHERIATRPARVVVARPAPPGPGYVWISGNWVWTRGHYVYRQGYWVRSRPGRAWIDGHWAHVRGGWHWTPGHWRRL